MTEGDKTKKCETERSKKAIDEPKDLTYVENLKPVQINEKNDKPKEIMDQEQNIVKKGMRKIKKSLTATRKEPDSDSSTEESLMSNDSQYSYYSSGKKIKKFQTRPVIYNTWSSSSDD